MILFLSSLAGTCCALKHWSPERKSIPVVSEKLATLAKKGSTVDALFLGTSRTFRQIDPEVFDARMAEMGEPTLSYNLAADGMNFPETFYVLERALKTVPRLKLVILEAGSMQLVDNEAFAPGSLRSIYWRDLPRTWMITRSILRSPGSSSQPMSEWAGKIWHQLELMAINMANLGHGSDLLTEWLYLPPENRRREVPANGFAPVDRRMSKSDLNTFRTRMKTKKTPEDLPLRADPELRERLDRLVTNLRNRGVEVCFVFMPAFRRDRPEVPSPEQKAPVIDLDDPNRHPEFFREENYYDPAHLNKTGSAPFTRTLAEEVNRSLPAMR